MTPLDIIGWALAIGIAWSILSSCIPFEIWISSFIASVTKRRNDRSPDEPDRSDQPGDRLTQEQGNASTPLPIQDATLPTGGAIPVALEQGRRSEP